MHQVVLEKVCLLFDAVADKLVSVINNIYTLTFLFEPSIVQRCRRKDAKHGKVVCDQVPEGENHTLLARREELNTTMMEQGCTRDMDKWGTVWSQVSRQVNN